MLIFSRLRRLVRSPGLRRVPRPLYLIYDNTQLAGHSQCPCRQAHSQAGQSMVRSLLCFLCLLKPEQVFNFNYPKKKEKQKRCDNAFSCCWCCCLVAKSYPTVCNPMYCRTSGSSFLYYLLEFAQINVH